MDVLTTIESVVKALRDRRVHDAVISSRSADPAILAAALDDPELFDRIVRLAPAAQSWQALSTYTMTIEGEIMNALRVAALCNSVKFLAAFREHGGRFGEQLPALINDAAENWAWEAARWLLGDPSNSDEIRAAVTLGTITPASVGQRLSRGQVSFRRADLKSLCDLIDFSQTVSDTAAKRLDVSIYQILRFALLRLPGAATADHLVKALTLVTVGDPRRPEKLGRGLADCHAIIKLLLYHNADHQEAIVRRQLDPTRSPAVYRGLAKQVYEVAAWRKWIMGGHIGGLPPELAENIMYRVWEPTY